MTSTGIKKHTTILDLTLLKKSGLDQKQLAIIFGVSRLTVNKYLQGKAFPGVHTAPRIEHAANVIASLIEKGKLPLSYTAKNDTERRKLAAEKIANHVKQTLAYA